MLYRFENCVLDIERRELRRAEIVCPIEPQVFDLLQVLIANRDRVVSRDEIFRTVWQGRIVSDSVLGNRINAARKAIGDDGTQQRLIRTLRRNGFRFVGTVCEGPERSSQAEPKDTTTVAARKVSLVVLPLSSGSADEELACVGKGIADDLTIALARSRSFDVIAHYRVCTDGDDPMRVAREFGAAYLVACGVRKASGELRLSVRLIEACTGVHIWARSYTQGLTTGFADQDAVTAKIAAALEPYIFAAEARRRRQKPSHEFDATDCVLTALSTLRHRSPQNYALAHKLLARA
jgi:DNA-binding winged helix-turn-helix (wHTH) protein